MKPDVVRWLACPICRGSLEVRSDTDDGEIEIGSLECPAGHSFPVVRGVPRLLPEMQGSSSAARSIHESFSREWSHFDYGVDRTWGQKVEDRLADFLRHIDRTSDFLRGRVVLDAGCGNGALSVAVSSAGCDVVATDISKSVEAAYRHFGGRGLQRTHFIQSDLMSPALRPEAFDVVYCAGVLHHTPDTRKTFESLLPALAPGGRIFVWLYWRESGLRARLIEALRRILSPLPAPVKHVAVWLLLPQSIVRNRLNARRGRTERLNAREILVRMLDSYTPRYRWNHTPDEVRGWYESHGFVEIDVTEEGRHGFGIAATRPNADLAHAPTAN